MWDFKNSGSTERGPCNKDRFFFGFTDWVPVLSGAIMPEAVRN